MSELRRLLQDGDPLQREPALARNDVDRMRRAVVAAGRERLHHLSATGVVLLTGLATVAGVCVWAVGPSPSRVHMTPATQIATETSSPANTKRRQLHFSTPGGTRVIWVFNSQFQDR